MVNIQLDLLINLHGYHASIVLSGKCSMIPIPGSYIAFAEREFTVMHYGAVHDIENDTTRIKAMYLPALPPCNAEEVNNILEEIEKAIEEVDWPEGREWKVETKNKIDDIDFKHPIN